MSISDGDVQSWNQVMGYEIKNNHTLDGSFPDDDSVVGGASPDQQVAASLAGNTPRDIGAIVGEAIGGVVGLLAGIALPAVGPAVEAGVEAGTLAGEGASEALTAAGEAGSEAAANLTTEGTSAIESAGLGSTDALADTQSVANADIVNGEITPAQASAITDETPGRPPRSRCKSRYSRRFCLRKHRSSVAHLS